jgi:hypothetical protein
MNWYSDICSHGYAMLIIKVETGRVDGQRLCVTGESAGGFTTLACLAFRQTFKAGCSLYGESYHWHFSPIWLQLNQTILTHAGLCCVYKQIADLTSLRAGSHKFEACYTDNLVGREFCTRVYFKVDIHFFRDYIDNITLHSIFQGTSRLTLRERQ